tara:strand:- start:26 stop:289 length:264 start_codon:yes stop_codon:yes gene_type:complete
MNQKEMENEILEIMLNDFVSNYIGRIGEVGNSPLMKKIEQSMLAGDLTKAEARRMDRAATALVVRLSKEDRNTMNLIRSRRMLGRYR